MSDRELRRLIREAARQIDGLEFAKKSKLFSKDTGLLKDKDREVKVAISNLLVYVKGKY